MVSWAPTRANKMAPYACLIVAQIIVSTSTILNKIVFTQGTNTVVFLVYQFSAATIFMALLAFFKERKARPSLSLSFLCWMFMSGLLGATLFQNLLAASLNYTSSTTQIALCNLLPAFTYILSIASQQEAPELNRLRGIGKLSGTLLSVLGAFIMIFWHGGGAIKTAIAGSSGWIVGYIMVTLGILSESTWLMLQNPMSERYPAELSMTAMMYLFATLQTCLLAAFMRIDASQWKLNWDLELLNILYGGVLNSGIGTFIYTWCAREKGPLFVAVFSPLTLLFTAVLEMLFLGDTATAGSIAGSLTIAGGLYLYLWSKSKEESDNPKVAEDEITYPILSDLNP